MSTVVTPFPRPWWVPGLFAVGFLSALSACAPFALEGESCIASPCAVGLLCVDDVCETPPVPPPPPCQADNECPLDGDASGRICENGVCRFDDCAFDAQCGTRICEEGRCAPRVPCIGDRECDDGDLCTDNVCRPACQADDECGINIGGISLNTCVEGRCLQRCLNDATCFGQGLCEGGICVEPACVEADDCDGENVLCNGGRCETFVPCENDAACFDANLFCDLEADPVRCSERPLCNADADCGLEGICLDGHCRPVDGCFVDDDCTAADNECVGGRCVRAPLCRQNADCAADQQCIGLRCLDADDDVEAASILMADSLGLCDGCTRTVFAGERLPLLVAGFDDVGLPVRATLSASSSDDLVATVSGDRAQWSINAVGAGDAVLRIASGAGSAEMNLRVLDVGDGVQDLRILVSDAGLGVADVDVDVGGVVLRTDADGLAVFDPIPESSTIVARIADRGVALVASSTDLLGARLRLPLPLAPSSTAVATPQAPLRATVTSTGDELGAVGLGLVLPATSLVRDAGLTTYVGDAVQAAVEIPVLGAVPVTLPSAMTLEANITLVGLQNIRPAAEVVTVVGPAGGLAFEGRREQQDLIQIALGGDATQLALDLFADAEGLDAEVFFAGSLAARALVPDSGDRDGDGNTAELVPDFDGADEIDVRPSRPLTERTSLVTSIPGGGEALMVAGIALPGRFFPTGVGRFVGLTDVEGTPIAESFKAAGANAGTADFPRVVVVQANLEGTARTSAVLRADALPSQVALPSLLSPPTGAFLLPGVPQAGQTTLAIDRTGGDLVRVTLDAAGTITHVYLTNEGTVLPTAFNGARLLDATLYGAVGLDGLRAGEGPIDLDESAPLRASAQLTP